MNDSRIKRINSDRWIGFSRSKIVECRLLDLMATPRQSRMPDLVVYGASGMGKTMIARKFAADFPSVYDPPTARSVRHCYYCRRRPRLMSVGSIFTFCRPSALQSPGIARSLSLKCGP